MNLKNNDIRHCMRILYISLLSSWLLGFLRCFFFAGKLAYTPDHDGKL